jgi:hypothetical protein
MYRHTKGLLGLCAFLVSVFLITPGVVFAQTGTTSLRGTVTDPKGSSVPDATITIMNAEIGVTQTTKTDREGAYQFLELRPATYILTVEAAGFATVKQSGLVLLVSTPRTNDIKLDVASVATTVEVVSSAQTINTTDATIGNAFNQTQISALPFEGRDPTAILSLQPGVVTVADRGQVDLNQDSRGGSVNGARSDQTNVTLDGIDNNDQLQGLAFTGALRATLDSIEEFRVTTTNAGVDQGRSSGAQVQLVTKSGTNNWHGTAYEYNRPTNTVANDYFNKHSELTNGEPNKPPHLLRNTFGGSLGGPIHKDRLFFFVAYEGQRTRENTQVTRAVPSDTLRQGIIQYQCSDASQCPGGTLAVQGVDANFNPQTVNVTVPAGFTALGTDQIAQMDTHCTANATCPWGPGVDPNTIATMNLYPHANSSQLGDNFNYRAFTFSAPTPNKLDTYVAKFDYNLNQAGSQRLFVRLGLQNDHGAGAPQFPGLDPNSVNINNSKGVIAGYSWTLSPTKVNNLHYGFVRQGIGNNGASQQQFVYLRGLPQPVSDTRSTNVVVPVHNLTDDFSWTRGRHTWQFGGNWRFINNIRASNAQSFSDAFTNAGFLPTTGFAGNGISFDPGAQTDGCAPANCPWNFPAVDSGFANSYDFPMMALSGIITEVDATYQRDKNGNSLASPDNPGAFIHRHFRAHEFEAYLQDTWRIKSNLTFTYGLRYSLLQPPYEINGNQVGPDQSLHDFFEKRMSNMVQGVAYSPNFTLQLAGQANGQKPYWDWDYKNIAPRVSLAWSPGYQSGLLGSLFGGPGKSSIRLGAGIYYDHFGEGIVNTFDKNGSFGLTTTLADAPATVGPDDAPRYTGISDIPASLTPAGPTGAFPVQPPTADQLGGFAIYWGLDDKLKTPYSYGFDLSYSRELKGGFVFEAAYVGRLGRRLLQERDLMQPINLVDPKSGMSYFQAATIFRKAADAGVDTSQIGSIPFWENVFPNATGFQYATFQDPSVFGCAAPNASNIQTLTATQAMYSLFFCGATNETTPLFFADVFGFPAFPTVNGADGANGQLAFYQSQFASLYAWTSGGRSNYNALQLMLRHRATHGLSWDFNYTFSKSIDLTSDAERVNLFEGYGFGGGQVINAFAPGQMRAVSDYDMTHQINTNWVYEFPFGRGKKWGHDWNRGLDAILGGWSWSGLGRWTSGLPFIVQNGFAFPTNWELNGFATTTGSNIKTGTFSDCDGDPNLFGSLAASGGCGNSSLNSDFISNNFRFPYPGESGNRNQFRGPGYFGIDMALNKSWSVTEKTRLMFNWQVYNITNSVRFDAANAFPTIDSAGSFGKFGNTLTRPRVMEFALRLSF